jgi:hypothetical protein
MGTAISRAVERCSSSTFEGREEFWIVHVREGMSTSRAVMVAKLSKALHYPGAVDSPLLLSHI